MEYSEHDGVNLQLAGNTTEISNWYNFTMAIISVFIVITNYELRIMNQDVFFNNS